ncbi:hypothetical protein WJX82_003488 [Trebouxia sp. C0006]
MGAAMSHSFHHSRRSAQVQQCARLLSICGQQPQESSKCMLASMHASTYFQHPFCTEIDSGISSSTDRICQQQLQKEQCEEDRGRRGEAAWLTHAGYLPQAQRETGEPDALANVQIRNKI